MPAADLMSWREYYRLFPFDDLHRFHRPAALVASASGGDIKGSLRWLSPDPADAVLDGWEQSDLNTFAAFGVKPPAKD